MSERVIENPVINSPYEEPQRHFKFDDEGITTTILPERRPSAYFMPVPRARKQGAQQRLQGDWTEDRIEENTFVNRVRRRVADWRAAGYPSVTSTTRDLLRHWQRPDRERRLFFCQMEAVETAIWIAEVAHKTGDDWVRNQLDQANENANPGLFRIAFKMATGTGKTVLMAMLIAWQVLNKIANPHDARFYDAFLVVTPGITIRDRLRVLQPSEPSNYYKQHDIVPPDQLERLQRAKIVITNFHAFLQREKESVSRLTKEILPDENAFTETPDEMVRRVCRELGNKKNIIVLNDEAHHCYQRKPDDEDLDLTGDERKEAEAREEHARVWASGLKAVANKIGIRQVYDLSATPFFLRGSGYAEGTLFPWVISDFSLIDAIESGIVKVPRVPIRDNSMVDEVPKYRHLWPHVAEHLPKKGRSTDPVTGEPKLPMELEGALRTLYENYEDYSEKWQEGAQAAGNGEGFMPPVFIVVCNNTNVSKMVYDWISGWEVPLDDDGEITRIATGNLPLFRNDDGHDNWLGRPNTILVDSEALESGDTITGLFKEFASREIDEFKQDYRRRYPDRDVEAISDEDLLREVLNTVGKPGTLGANVRCVVSVSMLSEGWDAHTVTHILGIRAFGTQLLCEQVVGRGLRRVSYETSTRSCLVRGEEVEYESFEPEYAEVYGVPFAFIPSSGGPVDPPPPRNPTRVRALDSRLDCEITFPRVQGYRYDVGTERLGYKFSEDSRMILTTRDVPTEVQQAALIGPYVIHNLDDLKAQRLQEVEFRVAKRTLETYFRADPTEETEEDTTPEAWPRDVRAWLFPQILQITRQWIDECLVCHDNTFPQLLLFAQNSYNASGRIYRSIVAADPGEARLKPMLQPYDPVGSTRYVDFDTTRPVYATDEQKCHISHVVADTGSWEQKMAQTLEDMDEVLRYVKNHNLGFRIPYVVDGEEHTYITDFIAHIDDGQDDPLNLIIEVTGAKDEHKVAKVDTTRTLWVPAINNHGGFGRWAFIEIRDPWNAEHELRSFLRGDQT
ncbi:MAG: BPTD_3080 family restriction endonuclease [Armatimonadota bacterium]|jgi:type III restriction enzyme